MKKTILTLIFVCMCISCISCKEQKSFPEKEPEHQELEQQIVNKNQEQDQVENESFPETVIQEENPHHKTNVEQALYLIDSLGANKAETNVYYEDAVKFAEAVVSGDTLKIAEYTGGEARYYDFLKDVHISDYTLYPFVFTDETLKQMNDNSKYLSESGTYFVEFNVTSGDMDAFPTGKVTYYMGFEENPLSGNLLATFVPADNVAEHIFVSITDNNDASYMQYFIREFTTLYSLNLAEGRNYPDLFNFKHVNDSHLITHLMARCGKYNSNPPYTLGEINDYIESAFEGAEKIGEHEIDFNRWLYTTEMLPEDRVYGCSFYHGAATAEHHISEVREYESSCIFTVDVYADYSNFAKAFTLIYYFDIVQDNIPKLTMVELCNNMSRSMAVLSI